MLEVSNVVISGLVESVLASGYAMMTKPYNKPLSEYTEDSEEFKKGLVRMKKLVHASKETDVHCHDNALTGITVAFDVKYSGYWTTEAQRYHFLQIVTSASKMHKLFQMDLKLSFNKFTDPRSVVVLKEKVDKYKYIKDNSWEINSPKYLAFMEMISSCPMGIELFERCTTNYKQLQTMYYQRRNHKLIHDWREGFCKNFIEKLPYAKELIIGE